MSILERDWDNVKQRAKPRYFGSERINNHLNMIVKKLTDIEDKLILEEVDDIVEMVYNLYTGKDTSFNYSRKDMKLHLKWRE